MNLKIFDIDSQFSRPESPASIHFNAKGIITLNTKAVEIMQLSVSDQIAIAQDPDNKEDWYILKNMESGFKLRAIGKGSKQLAFNCVKLVKEFQAAFELKSSISLQIKQQPIQHENYGDMWLILTQKAKDQARDEKYQFAKTAK